MDKINTCLHHGAHCITLALLGCITLWCFVGIGVMATDPIDDMLVLGFVCFGVVGLLCLFLIGFSVYYDNKLMTQDEKDERAEAASHAPPGICC